ncbi:hypothetical protein CF319_g9027 [Tilletia indica]|nr:hypothetical protein CF319_g9027 [Tilletia indica]
MTAPEKMREGIAPLLGPNYSLWSERVKTVLRSHDHWSAVVPGTPPGEGMTAEEQKEWRISNAKAYGVIFMTTSDEIQTDLTRLGTENAKALWDHLEAEYRSKSVEARVQLKVELLDALNAPKASMREHIANLANIYQQLLQIGKPVDEEERCIDLLWSLPGSYQAFTWSVSSVRSWTELRSRILEAERSLKRDEEKNAKTRQDAAFAVYAASPARSSGYKGHPASRHGAARKEGNTFEGACWLCKQKGHRFYDCPHTDLAREVVQAKLEPTKNKDTTAMVQEIKKDHPSDVDWACAVGSLGSSDGHFMLDTGSSRHIVSERSGLSNYRTAAAGTGIQCANGSLMPVSGYGNLIVTTQAGLKIELLDVAHCPTAAGNLIGGKRLTKSGCSIVFDNTSATVTESKSGRVIMTASVIGENWMVPLETTEYDSAMATSDDVGDSETMYWHCCLCHVGESTLKAIAKAGTVSGMPKELGPLGFCSHCAEGKMSRSKHPRIPTGERETRPMSKIHVDPFGPVNLKDDSAMNGALHGLIITDEASHHVWVTTMRYKSEATKFLMAFHAQALTRYPDKPISRVRMDNAPELNSEELMAYWRKHGVKAEPSPRYAPQSNGVAERSVRTITEMCRTMLIAANLPIFFWPAAVRTAAYVKNRVSATGLKSGETPFEVLHGRPPRPERMRIFGCIAWGKIPEVQRTGKFDTKARPYIYLGPAFTNAHRLWDPITKKEIIEHSVVFDEKGKAVTLLEKEQVRQQEQQVAQLKALDLTGDDTQHQKQPVQVSSQDQGGGLSSLSLPVIMQEALNRGVVPEGAHGEQSRGYLGSSGS